MGCLLNFKVNSKITTSLKPQIFSGYNNKLHYCFETELSEMPGAPHGHGIKKKLFECYIFLPILPIYIYIRAKISIIYIRYVFPLPINDIISFKNGLFRRYVV